MPAEPGAQLGDHLRARLRPAPAHNTTAPAGAAPGNSTTPPIPMSARRRSAPSVARCRRIGRGPRRRSPTQHVGHAPRQVLAGRRDLHDSGGSLFRGGEFAGQRQRTNFAERHRDTAAGRRPCSRPRARAWPPPQPPRRGPSTPAPDRRRTTAHSTAAADARPGQRARVRDSATASPSWFSNNSDAEATPSTSSRSPWSLTLPRNIFSTSSAPSASPIDHCRFAILAKPQRTRSSSLSSSGWNGLSVSSASAALPCHNSDRASSSLADQPAAPAHRRTRQPLAQRDVGQRYRVSGGGHQQRNVGRLIAVNVSSANRIRSAGVVDGRSCSARTSSPLNRRAAAMPKPPADDLTEQRMVEPHVDAVVS